MALYMKGVDRAGEVFGDIYTALRQAIVDHGGSLSHHHGIGKIRQPFLKKMTSANNLTLLKKVKDASDPHNIFGIGNTIFGVNDSELS
ncbi:MAG: FAD-linked oxidase C-terminal domain-containing protein [Cyanobacteria bacterium J06555_13]